MIAVSFVGVAIARGSFLPHGDQWQLFSDCDGQPEDDGSVWSANEWSESAPEDGVQR